jgi:hypothetical protein
MADHRLGGGGGVAAQCGQQFGLCLFNGALHVIEAGVHGVAVVGFKALEGRADGVTAGFLGSQRVGSVAAFAAFCSRFDDFNDVQDIALFIDLCQHQVTLSVAYFFKHSGFTF